MRTSKIYICVLQMYLLKHMHEMVSIPEEYQRTRSLDSLRSLEMTDGGSLEMTGSGRSVEMTVRFRHKRF